MAQPDKKKRAIALAGGGPAAGLHIGVLAALEKAGVKFDVFALSCVGAWVGLVYNSRPGPKRADQTLKFFKDFCFRNDASHDWFPINQGFASDLQSMFTAWANFGRSTDLKWGNLVLPLEIHKSLLNSWNLALSPERWTSRELNYWVLNDVLAVHPFTRFMTSLVYKSDIKGLSKVYYEDNPALVDIFDTELLPRSGVTEIYHNAWRLADDKKPGGMQLFHNSRPVSADGKETYMQISKRSLCACSALPFIEESVEIGEHEYTEGALVDTVNFKNLLRDHPDLDEIWVNRIVDNKQVRSAKGLHGSLSNLPMQFAAEVGENDVKLFRQHLLNQTRMKPRLVEIPIADNTKVNFDWSHCNLQQGYDEGEWAAEGLLARDPRLSDPNRDA